jgi:hypothetical protein
MSVDISMTPTGVWNLLAIILTLVFIGVGFYFLAKFLQNKENSQESTNKFNIGYAFFFWATGLNQFLYICDDIVGLAPTLDLFLSNGELYLYIGAIAISIKTQILLMISLLILSATPLSKSIDLYLKNHPKAPVYKLSLAAFILSSIIFIIFFVINRFNAPGGLTGPEISFTGDTSTSIGQIINILLIIAAIYIFIVTLILIWNFFIFYLILAMKSISSMRVKSLLIFFGILILYIGLFVGNLLKPDLEGWSILFGPILFLIGMIVLIFGFNKKVF